MHLYIEETRIEREMTTMKETQRTLPVRTYPFCKGCEHEILTLQMQRLYSDNHEVEKHIFADCKFSHICLSLYERLTESFEREDEWNEDENAHEDMLDSDDYSFCDDVSWEDRQI